MFSLFRRGQVVNTENDTSNKSKKSKKDDSNENNSNTEERTKFVNIRYRRWLNDRIHGIPRPLTGKYDRPDAYPPSVLCLPTTMILCFPWLWEENCICTLVGRLGLCSGDESWARNAVMRYAVFLNWIGLCLGIFTCLSITDSSFELLEYASLATAELTSFPDNVFAVPVTLHLGLSAMAVDNPNTGLQEVVRYDQFCDILGNGLQQYIQEPWNETCGQCEDVRIQTVVGLIVAVVCFLPSMVVNCTRMYRTTDLNCQKVWATFLSSLSLAGFVLMYYQFTYNCWKDVFNDEEIPYTQSGEITEKDSLSEFVRVDFQWTVGYGMVTLYAAFGLKVVDFVCNCCIPTPAITRNTYEQKIYETTVQELVTEGRDPEEGKDKDESIMEEYRASV